MGENGGQGDLGLHLREAGAEATIGPVTERQGIQPRAVNLDGIGARKGLRIAIGGGQHDGHPFPGHDGLAADLAIPGSDAHDVLDRGGETNELPGRGRNPGRVGDEARADRGAAAT